MQDVIFVEIVKMPRLVIGYLTIHQKYGPPLLSEVLHSEIRVKGAQITCKSVKNKKKEHNVI